MRCLAFILFFSISLSAYSQTRLTCYVNSSMTDMSIHYPGESGSSGINNVYTPREAFSYGIGAESTLSTRWSINYGAEWLKTGHSIHYRNLVFGEIIDPRRGFTLTTGDIANWRGRLHSYLNVPFSVRYHLAEGDKWNYSLSAGPSVSYYLYTKSRFSAGNGGEAYKSNNSNDFLLSAHMDLRVERRLNDRWSVFASPTYRRSITSHEQRVFYGSDNLRVLSSYNVGLSLGALYPLSKKTDGKVEVLE